MSTRSRRTAVLSWLTLLACAVGASPSGASQDAPNRIVGGSVAPPGAYPFFASVWDNDFGPFCGGTLVSSRWVVTAAHCVTDSEVAPDVVVIGAWKLDDPSQGDVRSVSEIVVDPNWDETTIEHDVALLRLNTASTKPWARFAESVDPVSPGNTARVIGHGDTSFGCFCGSNDLRQVDLPIQSDATMSGFYANFSPFVMIGAGPPGGGKDACQGDSGGPLFIPGPQARLIGDVSFGTQCGNRPGVYGQVYLGPMRNFVDGVVDRPSNDDFPGPDIAGVQGALSGSNTDAVGQTGEPQIAGGPAETSVWYSWTAPESGRTTFNTGDATFDTALGVFSNLGDGLRSVASNNDFNGVAQSRVAFNAAAGTTYRVAVDGSGAAHGPFELQWTQNPPANDDFAGARGLSGPSGITPATNARATGEPGEPDLHGAADADSSVWFRWTPAESGPAVLRLRDVAGGFSPGMAVYTGTGPAALTQVAAGTTSTSLNVVAGTTYRVAVDGASGSTGAFSLEWLLAECNGLPATIVGAGGPIAGTAGDDVIVGSATADVIDAGAGADTICGFAGNDAITGGGNNDSEFGGAGNDAFRQGAVANGADLLHGEAGTDSVDYGLRTGPLTVTLNSTANDGLAGEGDTVRASVEDVRAGSAGDRIEASNDVVNRIRGAGGNDTVFGAAGGDTLIGDRGADRLFGEGGADHLDLVDGAGGDLGDGGADTDTAAADQGDTLLSVP